MQMAQQDPSQSIQRELQPHVHLLSTYRFPLLASLHPDKATEWLLSAPKIARDQAPFYWTYFDRPVDGTIYLVWQSLQLGHDYPSDGYIWSPQETPFQIEVHGGYILEMYHQKVGYSPGEQIASHTRRRYRLLPSRNPQHNGPNPDPSLWIVHYTQADPNDRMPANAVPIDMRIQQTLSVRQHLQSQGQIMQKDFMLHDRTNWPSISFPRGRPQPQQQIYGGNAPPARVPQAMAYPPQHQQGPPAKRTRPNPAAPPAPTPANVTGAMDDDEEDTSRGDLFDHTTPREISQARYKQNHEWMEEVLSSPYAINQIIPADLGLGIKGELASLTEGIFDAPLDPDRDAVKFNYVGRLDPGKAEEFRKRTTERIAKENREIEKMRAKHARRMAKFQKGSLVTVAEKQLRTAVSNPEDTGPEYWRLEGRIDDDDEDDKAVRKAPAKVADIVAKVEASLGRHARAVQELVRIQDGGYEEAPAIPSPAPALPSAHATPHESHNGSIHGSNHSGVMVGDTDMDIGNSAASLLDQFHTGFSATATPGSNNFPTPQANFPSAVGTPSALVQSVPSPAPVSQAIQQPLVTTQDTDIKMSDNVEEPKTDPSVDASGTGEWVVVPQGGVSPPLPAQDTPETAPRPAPVVDLPAQPQPQETSTPTAPAAITEPSPAAAFPTAGPSSTNTPGLIDFHTSPNDFADLGDLDSAGDALAGYAEPMTGGMGEGDLGELGLDMDVGMDDSAFGDAFHGASADSGEREEGTGGLGDHL